MSTIGVPHPDFINFKSLFDLRKMLLKENNVNAINYLYKFVEKHNDILKEIVNSKMSISTKRTCIYSVSNEYLRRIEFKFMSLTDYHKQFLRNYVVGKKRELFKNVK
jgi:hypothetical protein